MVAGSGTTRREFLQRLGVAGGAGITLGAMTTLGLVTPVEATKVNDSDEPGQHFGAHSGRGHRRTHRDVRA